MLKTFTIKLFQDKEISIKEIVFYPLKTLTCKQ